MTSAPACANNLTAAAPIPREPPVMSAALPASEIMWPPKLETENQKSEKSNQPTTSLSLLSDGLTGASGSYEILEKTLRKRVLRHALGMPLNADDPV